MRIRIDDGEVREVETLTLSGVTAVGGTGAPGGRPSTDLAVTVEGGAAQAGAVRRLMVDVVATDLANGPITLYAPDAGELVGPVYLYDVTFCGTDTAITIGRDEQVSANDDFPALAGWDSDLAKDSAGMEAVGTQLAIAPLTVGPVTAGFTADGTIETRHAPAWTALSVYAQFDHIVAAGHIWECDPGGTSGASQPDFAGNLGGSVADGDDIIWNDFANATVGSATVVFDVCTPDPV